MGRQELSADGSLSPRLSLPTDAQSALPLAPSPCRVSFPQQSEAMGFYELWPGKTLTVSASDLCSLPFTAASLTPLPIACLKDQFS